MKFCKLKYSLPWLLFSLGLLIAVVYPIFTYEYLYHDDWHNFAPHCPWQVWFNLQGRPLGGFISCFQFDLFHYIKDAYIARVMSFAGLAVLFVAVYEFLLREDYPENLSAFIAFCFLTIPGALVLASYLSTGFIIFAFLASVISALLCQSALKRIAMDKSAYILILASIVMQIVSALIYQTGTMYFLVFAAVAMAHSFKRKESLLIRSAFVYGMIFIAANLIYFAGFKYFVGDELARISPRGMLFQEMDSAFIWFFQTVLPRAFSLWFIKMSAGWVPTLTGFFFFASFILYIISILRKGFSRRKLFLGIAYVIIILSMGIVSFFPILITAVRMNMFRNLIPLSSFILALTCVHLWLAYSRREKHAAITYLIVPAMLFIAYISHNVLLYKMILPKNAEVNYVEDVMWKAKVSKQGNFPVHVVIPRIKKTWSTDEIGFLSSSFYVFGDLYSMISHMRREIELPDVRVTYSTAGEQVDPKNKIIVYIPAISSAGLSGLEGVYEQYPLDLQAPPKYICLACGYVYDPAKGDPSHGIAPGTDYKDVPESWRCPVCRSHRPLKSVLAK